MRPAFTVSRTSIRICGKAIPGALDRQQRVPGFDQTALSGSSIVCIGAGGIISQIAPTLARKGVGRITVLDDDVVEPTNLNRQRFYIKDVGKNKAISLARNLKPECIAATDIRGIPLRFQEAVARQMDLSCAIAICGVDNNPARVAASRFFRAKSIPVIFAAVSTAGDHGYVFVQEADGPCLMCLYPDIAGDKRVLLRIHIERVGPQTSG